VTNLHRLLVLGKTKANAAPSVSDRRTWDSPVREPWNPKIHLALKSVDLHVSLYLRTGDSRHLEMADALRAYVRSLKDWIHEQEGRQ
jgi:hypothetical protein